MSIQIKSKDLSEYLHVVNMLKMLILAAGEVSVFLDEEKDDPGIRKMAGGVKVEYDLEYPRVCRYLYRYETNNEISIVDYYRACAMFARDFGAVVYALEYLDAKTKIAGCFEIRSPWRIIQGYEASKQQPS